MIRSMYPFWSAILSAILAQLVKPAFHYLLKKEWDWKLIKESGGFPSSHSALVSSLALSIGLQERFSSTLFAISLALAVIVIYDAANVRYYSGQNIKITQQLIRDIQGQINVELDNPIYYAKIKNVLGHKWIEIIGGITLGVVIALLFHFSF